MYYVVESFTLLHAVVGLVVIDHPFANHFHGLEFFEHDCFTALCADAAGHVVNVFAVCQ
jgi:hypothetical protein